MKLSIKTLIGFFLTFFVLWFFRDPKRNTPQDENLIISSADGKVCLIDEAFPPDELPIESQKMKRICVFMNVFNVHVNRSPVQGNVDHIVYKEGKFLFSANSRSKVTGNLSGMVKVYSHRDSDKILGAHIIGEHAGELIGEFVVSIEMGASAEDIALICHAHPTLSESIKEASSIASYGKTIHS